MTIGLTTHQPLVKHGILDFIEFVVEDADEGVIPRMSQDFPRKFQEQSNLIKMADPEDIGKS